MQANCFNTDLRMREGQSEKERSAHGIVQNNGDADYQICMHEGAERKMDMKLELVPVPVSDIDRAKAFYVEKVGFHADLDVRPNDTVRIVQLTPPGSACSIVISTGLPTIEIQTGSLRGLHLVVGDIYKARES